MACLCFNVINYSGPVSLSDLLHLYIPSRSLRPSAHTCLLKLPLFICKTKGDRAFSCFCPSVWNSLPLHIRYTTINTFKSALRTHLFNLQEFDWLSSVWWVCVCVCVCVCACVRACVRACVHVFVAFVS